MPDGGYYPAVHACRDAQTPAELSGPAPQVCLCFVCDLCLSNFRILRNGVCTSVSEFTIVPESDRIPDELNRSQKSPPYRV